MTIREAPSPGGSFVTETRKLTDAEGGMLCTLRARLDPRRRTAIGGEKYRVLKSIRLESPVGKPVDLVGCAALAKSPEIQVYDEKLGFEGRHLPKERPIIQVNLPQCVLDVASFLHEL